MIEDAQCNGLTVYVVKWEMQKIEKYEDGDWFELDDDGNWRDINVI